MPEFTKLNPFQKVPVIEHDGFVLTERLVWILIKLKLLSNKYFLKNKNS